MEEPSQFSVGQTAQSLTYSIMEKPHTGLDECLSILRLALEKGCLTAGRLGFHTWRVPPHRAVAAVPERDGGELPAGGEEEVRRGGGGQEEGEGGAAGGRGEAEAGDLPQRGIPRVPERRQVLLLEFDSVLCSQ